MPKTYETVDQETEAQVYAVMKRFHPHLAEVGVKLDILFAHGPKSEDGELTGPAITVGGYAALACIKINSLKDRVAGKKDAEMQIDGDQWGLMPKPHQITLIDHELEHLKVKMNGQSVQTPKYDDIGRPLLKSKKHDWQIGGFDAVADRHKEDAIEVQHLAAVGKIAVRQGWLPGF